MSSDPFWRLKMIYGLFYAAHSAVVPFLAVYYKGLGLSYPEIGLLGAIAPLVALV